LGGDELSSGEESAVVGGVSGRLRSIHRAGRKRKGWRSFPASRRSSGRLLAAVEGDGHGELCRLLEENTGRRSQGERKEKGGALHGVAGVSRESSRPRLGKQEVAGDGQRASTQVLFVSVKKTKGKFAHNPLALQVF
jgi:hypothetical protein